MQTLEHPRHGGKYQEAHRCSTNFAFSNPGAEPAQSLKNLLYNFIALKNFGICPLEDEHFLNFNWFLLFKQVSWQWSIIKSFNSSTGKEFVKNTSRRYWNKISRGIIFKILKFLETVWFGFMLSIILMAFL